VDEVSGETSWSDEINSFIDAFMMCGIYVVNLPLRFILIQSQIPLCPLFVLHG
jgi:hypothetical protein